MCDQQSLRSACAYVKSDQSLCYSIEYSMIVKLLAEQHLEFLSLKGGCRGSSESSFVKMPHCIGSIIILLNYGGSNWDEHHFSNNVLRQMTVCTIYISVSFHFKHNITWNFLLATKYLIFLRTLIAVL